MEGQCQVLCDSNRHWWLMPRAGPSSRPSFPRTQGLVVLPGMLCVNRGSSAYFENLPHAPFKTANLIKHWGKVQFKKNLVCAYGVGA